MNPVVFMDALATIAKQHGQQTALRDLDGNQLSYAELWTAVTQLGSGLIHSGIDREQLCAVRCSQSTDYVISVLACWWAGAAALLLDTAQGSLRIDAIISQASCDLVLDHDLVQELRNTGARKRQARVSVQADNLAWVVASSGSSGKPKLIESTHRGLVAVLRDQIRHFAIGPGDQVLWALSPGFDASLSDIGTALLSGACLHIANSELLCQADGFLQWCADQGITHADIPPALLPRLSEADCPGKLRCFIIGGEVADSAAVQRWSRKLKLVSVYGPSEATICTSLVHCQPDWDSPDLGTPIGGALYKIVPDPPIQGAEDACTGELWIGGPVLARGYRNQPALTTARFVNDAQGQRWYRSGDWVHRETNGKLLFRGRKDRQLKRHGQLVAPEEIEATLHKHPAVKEAAVVDRAEGLIGFVVLCSDHKHTAAHDIQSWCQRHLPRWLLADHLVIKEDLPRLHNAKCDYQQLRTMAWDKQSNTLTTEREYMLAEAWQAILSQAQPGRDDDFFACGGDSFAVAQLLAEAEQRGISLTGRAVYQGRSIAGMLALADHDDRLLTAQLRADCMDLVQALPTKSKQPGTGKQILLTGATGFLGIHLLEQLQALADQPILAIVRATNTQQARQRIHQQAKRYACRIEDAGLELACADLSDPHWYAQQTLRQQAADLGSIVHCAAKVSVVGDYDHLRACNVQATANVIACARTYGIERLHLASTLSVLLNSDRGHGTVHEHDDASQCQWLDGGYAQSKWASEQLCQLSGTPTTHYRLGLLTGHRLRHLPPRQDWLSAIISGLAILGCAPAGISDKAFDWTPVDDAARFMALKIHHDGHCPVAAKDKQHYFTVHGHIISGQELIEAMHAAGIELAVVESKQWQAQLEAHPGLNSWQRSALKLGLADGDLQGHHDSRGLFQCSQLSLEDANTRHFLQSQQCAKPSIDTTLVQQSIDKILAHHQQLAGTEWT